MDTLIATLVSLAAFGIPAVFGHCGYSQVTSLIVKGVEVNMIALALVSRPKIEYLAMHGNT
jgi:hypothetical protein